MSRIAQIEAELDALGDSASAEDIAYALRRFDKRDIQAVLASRSGEGGGAALTVTDGSETVENVTELELTGGTITETAPGVAEMTVTPGEQRVYMVGPVEINWNDAGAEDTPGIKIADIDAGGQILKTMVYTITNVDTVVTPMVIFSITGPTGTPRHDLEAWNAQVHASTGSGMTIRVSGSLNVDNGNPQAVGMRDDGGATALYARFAYDSGTLDAGLVRCYALIAEPAT